MGNTEHSIIPQTSLSSPDQAEFLRQLTYIQSVEHPMMGAFQIFRFKDPPYDYIMKNKHVFVNNDPFLKEYLHKLCLATTKLCHKNIAQIHYYKTIKQYHMCGKSTEIQVFSNYYAFTLEQIIRKRRKDDNMFTSNQIWYVLKNLLEISVLLRSNSFNYTSYKSKFINVSSQGYLKLYVVKRNNNTNNGGSFQSESTNQYSNALSDRFNINNYLPLPPQYLPSIKDKNLNFRFIQDKQDSFMIATIILQMMTDQDIRNYYTIGEQQFCIFKKQRVLKDLYKLRETYQRSDFHFLQLIERMLEEDPKQRISPEAALELINQNRENIIIGGSLKIVQDQQNKIQNKVSYRTSFDFQSNILKSIEPNVLQLKLTACPIKTFSKRTNKLLGVSLTTSSKKSFETKERSLNKSNVSQSLKYRSSSLSNKNGPQKSLNP